MEKQTDAISEKSTAVLTSLRAERESASLTDASGTWFDVYLDNARLPGMSAHEFAGHLSALKAAGVYRPLGDPSWGMVLIAAKQSA